LGVANLSDSIGYADSLDVIDRSTSIPTSDWAGSLGRWMIFCAGLTVLVAVLLLPAQADLRQTRMQRDLALHIEQTQHTRIQRYKAFLHELEHPTDTTIDLLAMSQLGMIRVGHEALIIPGQPADPQLFEFLEPTTEPFEPKAIPVSRLETLTTGDQSRLWVALLGAVAVLYGLLPPARP